MGFFFCSSHLWERKSNWCCLLCREMGIAGLSMVSVLHGLFRSEEKQFGEVFRSVLLLLYSCCLSKFIPWNKNKPALIQSHPGAGLGGSWEVSREFSSPAQWDCQEMKVPRAAPKNRKKPWKRESFSSWAASEPRGISWISRTIPKMFSCPVLRAGVVFLGTFPSYSWFPSLPHTHPGIPRGRTCPECPISVLISTQHLIN